VSRRPGKPSKPVMLSPTISLPRDMSRKEERELEEIEDEVWRQQLFGTRKTAKLIDRIQKTVDLLLDRVDTMVRPGGQIDEPRMRVFIDLVTGLVTLSGVERERSMMMKARAESFRAQIRDLIIQKMPDLRDVTPETRDKVRGDIASSALKIFEKPASPKAN
jgi:hypothetical protein